MAATKNYSPPVKESAGEDPHSQEQRTFIALAFRDNRLKNKFLNLWRIVKQTKQHSQFKREILEDIGATITAKSVATLTQKLKMADGCYLKHLKSRVFGSWHNFHLMTYKTRISDMIAERFRMKRTIEGWR
jgi:hypothetical protein